MFSVSSTVLNRMVREGLVDKETSEPRLMKLLKEEAPSSDQGQSRGQAVEGEPGRFEKGPQAS